MEIIAKSHLAIGTYEFVEFEFAIETDKDRDNLHKDLINSILSFRQQYKDATTLKGAAPVELGETITEHGHTYKAVMNEKTKKLYWLIDRI